MRVVPAIIPLTDIGTPGKGCLHEEVDHCGYRQGQDHCVPDLVPHEARQTDPLPQAPALLCGLCLGLRRIAPLLPARPSPAAARGRYQERQGSADEV
jgi:hypothetical protein